MHSKIFQLRREPIDHSEYISESDYYDCWFTNSIADYVDDLSSKEQNDCWDWLKEYSKGAFKINFKKRTLTIIDKKAYFKSKYEEWKKIIEDLCNNTTEDSFINDSMGGVDSKMYELNAKYQDKYGFYVDDNDECVGLEPLDKFMRDVSDGDVFYLGGVVDYHF